MHKKNSIAFIFYTIFLHCFFVLTLRASHGLAGQITYKKIGTNTYEILVTTYTDPIAQGVDRCSVSLEIWDAQGNTLIDIIQDIPRVNGPSGTCPAPSKMGIFIRPRIKKNYYRTVYTFSGPGVFQLRYYDFARVFDIINMTNSDGTAFYVQTILNNIPVLGDNNSPVLLNDPIDDACTGKLWSHNPGGYDPDGDSLVYSLVPCQQYDPPNGVTSPVPVINYQYPSAFGGSFTIDSQTGLIVWDTPQQVGIYAIAIKIEEYRDGRKIGEVIRDMVIFVTDCNNNPPEIIAPDEVCLKIGDTLNINILARDPDIGDSLYLYLNNGGQGNNGPFQLQNNPAVMNPNVNLFPLKGFGPIPATLTWAPLCEHLRSGFYQVDLYAHDNLGYDPPLHADKIIKISLRPPDMDSLNLQIGMRKIILSWKPAQCFDKLIKYEIYRAEDSLNLPGDSSCCPSDAAVSAGFEKIAEVSKFDTTFVDSPLTYRPKYCYTVVAVYEENITSCPAPQVCVELPIIYPLLTHDSVRTTDIALGEIQVRWMKPDTSKINQTFFPPPYSYNLYRTVGNSGNFALIASGIPFTDTEFADNNLNTETNAYKYKVEFLDGNNQLITESEPATSIFLRLQAFQNAIRLTWDVNVPWQNRFYVILRRAPGTPNFVPVDTVQRTSYLDEGLQNSVEYCYVVVSYGGYSDTDTFINASQKVCGIPIDKTPPCLPDKDSILFSYDCEQFFVNFQLQIPPDSCASDWDKYKIYYGRYEDSPLQLLTELQGTNLTYTYDGKTNQSIAGCYYISLIDTVGNESEKLKFCIDNCPYIELPNVITPNGDGINDVFVPISMRSIERLRTYVYDRWGNLLSVSENKEVLWNGTYKGNPVPEGVYFYKIEIVPARLAKDVVVVRTGSITVIR